MANFGRLPRTVDRRDYQLAPLLPRGWQEQLAAFKQAKRSKLWMPTAHTDQDGYGHCTTFTDADFQNTPPEVRKPPVRNAEAHNWYYRLVAYFGRPRDENGAEMRELMKWMQKVQKRVDRYAWASSLEQVQYWVSFKGPVISGEAWLTDMMKLDKLGFIHATGSVEGLHAFTWIGWDSYTHIWTGLNHWADMQLFQMSEDDFEKLHSMEGELVMTPELARRRLCRWLRALVAR